MTLRTVNGELYAGEQKVLKGWESFSGWYWFAVEKVREQLSDFDDGGPGVPDVIWFGFVQGLEEEWGDFSEAEIARLGNMAWPIKPQDLPYAGRRG